MKEMFILIITGVGTKDSRSISNAAIMFSNFNEALDFARKDAKHYKHLASVYNECVGDNKCHATIKLYGKYINKMYRISNMTKGGAYGEKELENRMNTYNTYDYYDEGTLI